MKTPNNISFWNKCKHGLYFHLMRTLAIWKQYYCDYDNVKHVSIYWYTVRTWWQTTFNASHQYHSHSRHIYKNSPAHLVSHKWRIDRGSNDCPSTCNGLHTLNNKYPRNPHLHIQKRHCLAQHVPNPCTGTHTRLLSSYNAPLVLNHCQPSRIYLSTLMKQE